MLYLKGMKAHGITITALTPQNEPENANNTPSMLMTATEEANFIGQHLGPALLASGLHTRIIGFDHKCDHPGYPETILADPAAAQCAQVPLTLDGDRVARLTTYYTTAHASKVVPPGSIRIGSSGPENSLPNIACRTPDGHHGLIISNTGSEERSVRFRNGVHAAEAKLASGVVVSYVW